MTNLYDLRQVQKRYGHVAAVDGVDLEFAPASSSWSPARRGSGKTTLLQLLGALDRPTAGSVVFEGRDLAAMGDGELAPCGAHAWVRVPAVQPDPDADRARERRGGARRHRVRGRRAAPARGGAARACRAGRARRAPAVAALGRRAAAGGDRPRARERSARAAGRRADGQPRLPATGDGIVALLRTLCESEGLSVVLITHDTSIAERGPARRADARRPHPRAPGGGGRARRARSLAFMRILVVDDEPAVRARSARAGARGLRGRAGRRRRGGAGRLAVAPVDAVVLDVLMPGVDGLEVCRRLRAAGDRTPVLMLTARDAVADRVAGLDAGADDYLVKPFALDELLARLRALLRRAGDAGRRVLRFADLVLDPAAREVRRGERPIELTRTEFVAARAAPATPAPGAHALADLRARLGLRLRADVERPRRLRRLPAPQARGGEASRG